MIIAKANGITLNHTFADISAEKVSALRPNNTTTCGTVSRVGTEISHAAKAIQTDNISDVS